MADINKSTDNQSEESSSDDWQLNPLFINHVPTQEEIDKNLQLKGIQAMLEGGNSLERQGVVRTRGNNYMACALKNKQDPKEFKRYLYDAISLYNQAADMEVKVEEDVTQDNINERQAMLYSNRAEAFRLLGDYGRASNDAVKAMEYYPRYYKSYIRMGRICEDLGDWLRAAHYFQRAFELSSQNKDIQKLLANAVKQLRQQEEQYKILYDRAGQLFNFKLNFGMTLPYVNLAPAQIMGSYAKNVVTVYLLDENSREVLTV